MKGYRYGRKFIFGSNIPHKPRQGAVNAARAIPVGFVDDDFDDLELATIDIVNETRGKLDQQ